MNDSLTRALNYLTGSGNIDAVAAEDLEKLVNDHPHFPVAHFLLSKKLKKENSAGFLSQVQKTALYFPNPYWLHYQLINDLPNEPIIYETDEPAINEADESVEDSSKDVEDTLVPEKNIVDRSDDLEEAMDEHTITTEPFNEDTQEDRHTSGLDKPDNVPVDNEALVHDVIAENKTNSIEPTDITEEPPHNVVEPVHSIAHQHHEPASQAEEEMAAITRDTDETTVEFLNEISEEPRTEDRINDTEEVHLTADRTEPEDDEHEKMFQNIKAMLDASAEEANAGVKSTIVPIDPYYTIDYFAAQGIKLDLEKNPQDKLGKQVKKFTQWLKHMKKLGPEDALAAEKPSPAEVEAQTIADASNIAKEVVTEAMALVLEKQGKKDKAIQLYRKLTFLNPHKSAYFADKINHLNGL